MKKGGLVIPVLAFGFLSFAHAAGEINEVESNNSVNGAQLVVVPGGTVTINGVLGNISGPAVDDLDFYTFYGAEGDVVTFDIDGGIGGLRSVDTVIGVFGPAPSYTLLRMDDDAPVDPGSISNMDSRIENFRLPASGYYTVGVSNYPRYFLSGGTVLNPSRYQNGDYKLTISGVSEPILHINIDIKPGDTDTTYSPVNPKSRGKIPVALLSSKEFDATAVDTSSLRFGATGTEASLSSCASGGEDINGDGLPDLVCHFNNQTANFHRGDLEGILRGKSSDGRNIEGRGLLKIAPEKP